MVQNADLCSIIFVLITPRTLPGIVPSIPLIPFCPPLSLFPSLIPFPSTQPTAIGKEHGQVRVFESRKEALQVLVHYGTSKLAVFGRGALQG